MSHLIDDDTVKVMRNISESLINIVAQFSDCLHSPPLEAKLIPFDNKFRIFNLSMVPTSLVTFSLSKSLDYLPELYITCMQYPMLIQCIHLQFLFTITFWVLSICPSTSMTYDHTLLSCLYLVKCTKYMCTIINYNHAPKYSNVHHSITFNHDITLSCKSLAVHASLDSQLIPFGLMDNCAFWLDGQFHCQLVPFGLIAIWCLLA